jgi:hypothetical protein
MERLTFSFCSEGCGDDQQFITCVHDSRRNVLEMVIPRRLIEPNLVFLEVWLRLRLVEDGCVNSEILARENGEDSIGDVLGFL